MSTMKIYSLKQLSENQQKLRNSEVESVLLYFNFSDVLKSPLIRDKATLHSIFNSI